jgi:hypothetical protein
MNDIDDGLNKTSDCPMILSSHDSLFFFSFSYIMWTINSVVFLSTLCFLLYVIKPSLSFPPTYVLVPQYSLPHCESCGTAQTEMDFKSLKC